MFPPFLLFLYQIFFKLAGNEDRHKVLEEFEFQPDWTTPYRVGALESHIMESLSSVELSSIRIFCHTFLGNCKA